MMHLRSIVLVIVFVLSAYSTGSFAADVIPFSGTKTTEAGAGYDIKIGDKTFTLSEIQGMPTFQSTLNTIYNAQGTFVGVKFVDVLQRAGIGQFKRLFIRAANDYKVTVSSDDEGIDQALLVYRLNGKLLALNDKGPYWLIWPKSAEPVLAGNVDATKWSWSVVEILKVN